MPSPAAPDLSSAAPRLRRSKAALAQAKNQEEGAFPALIHPVGGHRRLLVSSEVGMGQSRGKGVGVSKGDVLREGNISFGLIALGKCHKTGGQARAWAPSSCNKTQ